MTLDPEQIISKGTGLCLDLGCGGGAHRKTIEAKGYKWIGLDIDTSRGDARMLEADAQCLPFKEKTFDIVWMNCVLEHIPNPWLGMAEIHRIIKDNGMFYGVSGYIDPDHTHFCAFTEKGLRKVLNDAGFNSVEISPEVDGFRIMLRKFLMYTIFDKRTSTVIAAVSWRILHSVFWSGFYAVGLIKNIITLKSISAFNGRFSRIKANYVRDFAAYMKIKAKK